MEKIKLGDRVIKITEGSNPYALQKGELGYINKVDFVASERYKEPEKHWDFSIDWDKSGFGDSYINKEEIEKLVELAPANSRPIGIYL